VLQPVRGLLVRVQRQLRAGLGALRLPLPDLRNALRKRRLPPPRQRLDQQTRWQALAPRSPIQPWLQHVRRAVQQVARQAGGHPVRVRHRDDLTRLLRVVDDQRVRLALRRAGPQARRRGVLAMPVVARHCGRVCLPASQLCLT
jgi:hypothetical protein